MNRNDFNNNNNLNRNTKPLPQAMPGDSLRGSILAFTIITTIISVILGFIFCEDNNFAIGIPLIIIVPIVLWVNYDIIKGFSDLINNSFRIANDIKALQMTVNDINQKITTKPQREENIITDIYQ